MALMQITIVPVGTGSTSVGDYVAGVQKLLRERGCTFELTDMGTVVHGTISELLRLAVDIHEYPFSCGAQRVVTNIMLDDRRDKRQAIGDKRRAVRARLGGEI